MTSSRGSKEEHAVFLTLPVTAVDDGQRLIEGAVILGAAQGQHLVAVTFVPPQAPKHRPHVAQIQPREGRFNPLQGLNGVAIVHLGHLVEIRRAVVIVEDLSGLGEQGVDLFPSPGSPIADPAQSHLLFGDQAHSRPPMVRHA